MSQTAPAGLGVASAAATEARARQIAAAKQILKEGNLDMIRRVQVRLVFFPVVPGTA